MAQIKILLVDDDENIRTMYAEILANAGFSVEEAIDGADGLDKASKNVPDLIFTGIDMPQMDGFTLIESLKKDPVLAKIPIMMSSHRGRKEDEARARELGVRDFIVYVTVTPRQVIERIKAIFESASYLLKFDTKELDAQKLANDLNIDSRHYVCSKCGESLVLSLKVSNIANHEFTARFICPVCK